MIVATTLDLFNNPHKVKLCEQDDIDTHFSKIAEFIPENEHAEFKVRMLECVEVGSAFALEDDSCFLYYINYKPCFALGIAMFGKGVPVKFIALFMGIFKTVDKRTFQVNFGLHKGKLLSEYKGLLSRSYSTKNVDINHPLTVRIDILRKKFSQLYLKRGVK